MSAAPARLELLCAKHLCAKPNAMAGHAPEAVAAALRAAPVAHRAVAAVTTLGCAAARGNLAVVQWIVAYGLCDIHANNDHALWLSGYHRQWDVLKWFLDYGDMATRDCAFTALTFAVAAGRLDIVRWLVEVKGVSARFDSDYALRDAAQYGHADVVRYLVLECGCDPHAGLVDRDDALVWGAHFGGLAVVEWLLSDEAGVTWTESALSKAQSKARYYPPVEALLRGHTRWLFGHSRRRRSRRPALRPAFVAAWETRRRAANER